MISDQKGNIWVGMPYAISRINGGLVNETFFDISQDGIQFLMESSDGSIWVPTRPGLHRYDQNMKQQSFQQMRWEWLYTMLKANDGTLWATSFGLHGSKTLWQFNGELWWKL